MEIDVLEDKKNSIIFEIKGADHTICNMLKSELNSEGHVKVATYSVKHPLISPPRFIVETDGDISPRNAVLNSINKVKKTTDRFRKSVLKEI